MSDDETIDPKLAFTVASVWRRERISCPHPHLLQSWLQGALQGGAQEFLDFHLRDSQCPYCNATIDEMRARDDQAKRPVLEDLRDRLLRSTRSAMKKPKG